MKATSTCPVHRLRLAAVRNFDDLQAVDLSPINLLNYPRQAYTYVYLDPSIEAFPMYQLSLRRHLASTTALLLFAFISILVSAQRDVEASSNNSKAPVTSPLRPTATSSPTAAAKSSGALSTQVIIGIIGGIVGAIVIGVVIGCVWGRHCMRSKHQASPYYQ